MKKSLKKEGKSVLVLRPEHIRVLTPADSAKVVGGAPLSERCPGYSDRADQSCG